MNDEPSSDSVNVDPAAGADRIDAYLVSVERVLLAEGAPSRERLQVLQDLESQIAEMLAQHALPLTDETVQTVIESLEPPSHFAAMYGIDPQEPQSSTSRQSARPPYNLLLLVAAVSCALIPISSLLLMISAAQHAGGGMVLFMLVWLIAAIVTPVALREGLQQLRSEPSLFRGRELALATIIAYGAIVPLLALGLACIATKGYILFPIGAIAFIYCQWRLTRRIRQRAADSLPAETASPSFKNSLWRFIRPAPAAPCA